MTSEDWNAIYADDSASAPVDSGLQELVAGRVAGSVLDPGCGLGQNSIWLVGQGWTVTGLDIAANAIARARGAAVEAGVEVAFEVADATMWEPAGVFDLVVSTYALPPAGPGRSHALSAAARAVAPGGTLYLAEFDRSLAETGWMPEKDLVTVEGIPRIPGRVRHRAIRSGRDHPHPRRPCPTTACRGCGGDAPTL